MPTIRTAKRKTPGKSPAGASPYPPVGKAAPAFSAESTPGKLVKLSDFKGKKIVVLYFYPRDNTPGCTREACGFRDVLKKSRSPRVEVLGMSCDSMASHENFRKKWGLPFPLLSDPDHKIAEKYGVWQQKTMAGRKYMGVVRTTFIIDKQGRIAHRFEKVKVDGHHDAVFEWIDANL